MEEGVVALTLDNKSNNSNNSNNNNNNSNKYINEVDNESL